MPKGGVWVGALPLGGWVPQNPSDPPPSYKRRLMWVHTCACVRVCVLSLREAPVCRPIRTRTPSPHPLLGWFYRSWRGRGQTRKMCPDSF